MKETVVTQLNGIIFTRAVCVDSDDVKRRLLAGSVTLDYLETLEVVSCKRAQPLVRCTWLGARFMCPLCGGQLKKVIFSNFIPALALTIEPHAFAWFNCGGCDYWFISGGDSVVVVDKQGVA